MERIIKQKFWCHICQKEVEVNNINDEVQCTLCTSTFVEELENNYSNQKNDNPEYFVPIKPQIKSTAKEIPKEEQELIFLPSTVNCVPIANASISTLISDTLNGFSVAFGNSLNMNNGAIIDLGTGINNFLQNHNNDRQFDNFINIIMNLETSMLGNPPASQNAIDSLKKIILDDNIYESYIKQTCNICLEEFQKNQTIVLLECHHNFHEDCIIRWLKMRNTCPVCRYEMESNNPDYERRKNTHRNNYRNLNNNNNGNNRASS